MDITTLALAKKFAKEYTDTHASKLTEENAIKAVANYFNENPNAIVTNDELETILNEYFKKNDLSDLENIRSGAALGATALQEHQDISSKADKTDIENVIYYEDGEEPDVDEVVLMSEFEAANNKLEESIAEKLTEPISGIEVGKYFRVASIDENGHVVLECADAPQSIDVQINGSSIVADGIANIPIGSNSVLGVFKVNGSGGIQVGDTGDLRVKSANKDTISKRNTSYQPIVPNTLDYAVKSAMCDGKGEAWTDAEKVGAWKRQTILKTAMDEIAVAGAQYYLGEQTAVNIVLPSDAQIGQMITVSWYNGATPANLSITGTMLVFEYIPNANTRSEINALWDGSYWAIIGNEIEVPN